MVASKPSFTLVSDKHASRQAQDDTPCVPQRNPSIMEDFIERTLRERLSLQGALADMMAKYDHIPCGSERSMLERMIEVLKDEIALRRDKVPIPN
jgi:hypothetical protein